MSERDLLYLHLRDLPYFRALIRTVEASYYQNLDLPSPCLDIGCGDGHFASLAFDHNIDVGVDPLNDPIHEASQRRCYRLLVQADGSNVPFPGGYFASAFSNSALEHIPGVEGVLCEIARVLRSGAPFAFSVPNERYLSALSLPRIFGEAYRDWFKRISRVYHADGPMVWSNKMEQAGFHLERWWHYFPPASMRVLEWGHYLGLPSLLARRLTGRWVLAPVRWNLWLVERLLNPYATTTPVENGTFTFYIASRR